MGDIDRKTAREIAEVFVRGKLGHAQGSETMPERLGRTVDRLAWHRSRRCDCRQIVSEGRRKRACLVPGTPEAGDRAMLERARADRLRSTLSTAKGGAR